MILWELTEKVTYPGTRQLLHTIWMNNVKIKEITT